MKDRKVSAKTYYVKGMHCASCEVLVGKEISKIQGVDRIEASLKKSCVVVTSSSQDFPDVAKLNHILSKFGYSVSLDKPTDQKLSKKDIAKVTGVFLLFITSFYFIEKSGLFLRFSVNGASSLTSYFLFGLLAGLSSCAALVGGLLLSMSGQWNTLYNGNSKESVKPFIYFNLSRLVSFALLGGVLGLIGSYISISMDFSVTISFLTSLLMLVIGFQMLNVWGFRKFKLSIPFSRYITDETNFKGKYMPVFIGAMTFFVPCGFTLIAQTNAVSSGSFMRGALTLVSFALGTLPVLFLISFSSVKLYSNRSFSKKFSLFSGMLITFFALYNINAQLNVLGLPSLSDLSSSFRKGDGKVVSLQPSGGVQYMQMEATTFAYYPPVFNLKAGVPTKWEIYDTGASGCARAVYARGLYPKVIYLKPGLNTIEFTPKNPGTYKISCSMGMVPPVTVNVF